MAGFLIGFPYDERQRQWVETMTVMSRERPATTGQRIKRARRLAGLTQRELAAVTGLDKSTIHKVETDRAQPVITTVRKIAEATGTEVRDLIDE